MKIPPLIRRLSLGILALTLELAPRTIVKFLKRERVSFQYSLRELLNLRAQFPRDVKDADKFILLDVFAVPHWIILNGISAHWLSDKFNLQIASFDFDHRNRNVDALYKSMAIDTHLRIRLNPFNSLKVMLKYIKIICWLSAENKLIDLEVQKVAIGVDIYESILRRGHATIDYFHRDTYRELWRGLKEFYFFLPKFERSLIGLTLLSHDNYVGPGLLSRMAYKYGVPVVLVNPFEIDVLTAPFELYDRFQRYPDYFRSLPTADQELLLTRSEEQLEQRLLGALGTGRMTYQISSAFNSTKLPVQTAKDNKLKVLVLAHDFFDNPHAYRRMEFDDFLQWLDFLAEVAKETDYHWYVKVHRDYSEIEMKIILDFIRNNPQFILLDPEVSYHQLRDEGIKYATTCYGSAGHELPLLGFVVINASYNPHIAYNFNLHPKNREEYRNLLVSLDSLPHSDIDRREVYEFYAVHTYIMWPDKFNFSSFSEFTRAIDGDSFSLKSLLWLEKNFIEIRRLVESNLLDTFSTMRKFSVESGLSPEMQEKFEFYAK